MSAAFIRRHKPGHGQFQTVSPHSSFRRSMRDGLAFAERHARKEQEKRK